MEGETQSIISNNNSNFKNTILGLIKKYAKRYFITAMNGMALGLFASLIIGAIINQFAKIPFLDFLKLGDVFNTVKTSITGAAIGAGVALALKNKNMVVISAVAAGAVGYIGNNPLCAFFAVILAVELGALVVGKTKVDIIVTPLVVILSAHFLTLLINAPIQSAMAFLSNGIETATNANPFVMGMILAVAVGMILTAPISSAALCISLGVSGIVAGAACVGCCVNMVGFAVCSYKKNGVSGLFSIGLGTSMLQFSNILRKPIIWLPVIISSAILGPISSVVFKMTNTSGGAGMGTSGLVGQFGAFEAMTQDRSVWTTLWQIGLMHFIAPIILVLFFNFLFKKIGWIKDEDYLLNRETVGA